MKTAAEMAAHGRIYHDMYPYLLEVGVPTKFDFWARDQTTWEDVNMLSWQKIFEVAPFGSSAGALVQLDLIVWDGRLWPKVCQLGGHSATHEIRFHIQVDLADKQHFTMSIKPTISSGSFVDDESAVKEAETSELESEGIGIPTSLITFPLFRTATLDTHVTVHWVEKSP